MIRIQNFYRVINNLYEYVATTNKFHIEIHSMFRVNVRSDNHYTFFLISY